MGNSHLFIGSRRRQGCLLSCLFLACFTLAACGTPESPDDPPVFKTDVEGEGNSIAVNQAGQTTIFEIRSDSGIGRGNLRLVSGSPPTFIVLRLYITGMEQFRLAYNGTTINASISSGSDRRVDEYLLLNGGEQVITPSSPFWMDITRPTGRDFIEISLPRDLIQKETGDFTIEWVDFFR
jgi:hypothetical protein